MLNQQDQLDRMFHALADANRRAMLDRLSTSDASVSQIAAPLNISLPAVMQHLALLEECGLVKTQKQGRVRTCTLDTQALSRAEQWINQRREIAGKQLDALGDFLSSTSQLSAPNRSKK